MNRLSVLGVVLPIAAVVAGSPAWAWSAQSPEPDPGYASPVQQQDLAQKMEIRTESRTWKRPANGHVVQATLVGGGSAGGIVIVEWWEWIDLPKVGTP